MEKQDYMNITQKILDTDWDETPVAQYEHYSIAQFQGTAFSSDYQVYKIHWSEWEQTDLVVLARKISHTMVAKITTMQEAYVLKLLSAKHFPVPGILAQAKLKNGKIIIFEQFCSGDELYSLTEDSSWIETTRALSEIHSAFWKMDSGNPEATLKLAVSNNVVDKIQHATNNVSHNKLWRQYMLEIDKRLSTAPKTLIHGDMFPTNILLQDNNVRFVDWADACVYSYMVDIGILTAIIDTDSLKPMCPCPDTVISTYYEKMKTLLDIDYSQYLEDIHMAQFIELASIYTPPVSYRIEREYNRIIGKKLNEIATAQ